MANYLNGDDIKKYYDYYSMQAIVEPNIFQTILCYGGRKNKIVVSESKVIRGICRVLRIRSGKYSVIVKDVENYYAMMDALDVLNKKNVAVYFYNRIGMKKKGFKYSSSAQKRIENEISFVKMVDDYSTYFDDLKELFGEKFSIDYVKKIQDIPQIIRKGNTYCHEDHVSKYVNVVDGKRITTPKNNGASHKIHIYGRCGAFGYAVEDKDNFPNQLQLLLTDNHESYTIVNHALWGSEDQHILNNFFYDITSFSEGDVVLFYMFHFDKTIMHRYIDRGMQYKDITDEWHKYQEAAWCFYDKPGHMNTVGYKHVAEIIYKDLKKNNFAKLAHPLQRDINAKYLNNYLKNNGNISFENEVDNYISSIYQMRPELKNNKSKTGAIVMNCNPFTLGHRYLVEYASKQVDKLIVFVVEEDKSYFKFEDRFKMVNLGTADIANVIVVPSGKFIISTLTFPEYFLKDYVKEKNFDLSQDLDTFCRFIAAPLNISYRFAGEEPFDPVTKNYNENMASILPRYGMQFVEIPRKKVESSDEVINATKVRGLIEKGNMDLVEKYLPQTTIDIIKEKYEKLPN